MCSQVVVLVLFGLFASAQGICSFVNYVADCQHMLAGRHNVEVRMTIERCAEPVGLEFVLQGHLNSTKLVWKHTFINTQEELPVPGFGQAVRVQVGLQRYADSNKIHLQCKFSVDGVWEDFISSFIGVTAEGCTKNTGGNNEDTGVVVLIVVFTVSVVLGILTGLYIWYMKKHPRKTVRDQRRLMNSVDSALNGAKKPAGCAGACGGSDSSTGYDNSLTLSSGSQDVKDGVIVGVHKTGLPTPNGPVHSGNVPEQRSPHETMYSTAMVHNFNVEMSDLYRNTLPSHPLSHSHGQHTVDLDSMRLAQVSSDSDSAVTPHKSKATPHRGPPDLRRSAIERSVYLQHQQKQSDQNEFKEYWIDSGDGADARPFTVSGHAVRHPLPRDIPPQVPPKTPEARLTPEGARDSATNIHYDTKDQYTSRPVHSGNNKNIPPVHVPSYPHYHTPSDAKTELRNGHISNSNGYEPGGPDQHHGVGYSAMSGGTPNQGRVYLGSDGMQSSMV